ncbi:hypothetical protein ACC685_37365, partial [Rhizobium ruizarguesonis]
HIGNANGRIADPGNVNEAGQLMEVRLFAGKVMVLMTGAIENGETAVPGQLFLPFDIHISEKI